MKARNHDVIVVGAGILGLATARSLLLAEPRLRVTVLEKEHAVGLHQTSHNSGVLHSGVYYAPGSLKARLCAEGKARLERYAAERGIPVARRGKLVVAVDRDELGRLAALAERAQANGVEGLRLLDALELRRVEPHVRGLRALHAPGTGVIDFAAVARAYAEDVDSAGGSVQLGTPVRSVVPAKGSVTVETDGDPLSARLVVTCAGLQTDRLARPKGCRIVPFRGDYYELDEEGAALVNGLVYPVPDPAFPFLGVHLTRHVDGTVGAGPNAVLALAREGYRRTSFSPRDAASTLAYPGFWRFAARHWRIGAAEVWRDVSKRAFVRTVQRYVPDLSERNFRRGDTGIRAQVIARDGRMHDDFVVERGDRTLDVISAPSPAATSSLAIADHLAAIVRQRIG
jgi:(S)-2-hydroxyglutarate dehydrogenase